MKDANWREVLRDPTTIKPEVKAYLEAENAYAKAMLAATEPLQGRLFEEMKGRVKLDDSTAPAPDGPYDYYVRYTEGGQHPVYARRPRGDSQGEQVLLDADAEAQGKGVGRFLAHALAEEAKRRGFDHITVLWEPGEEGPGEFFHRIGFTDIGETQYGDVIGSLQL